MGGFSFTYSGDNSPISGLFPYEILSAPVSVPEPGTAWLLVAGLKGGGLVFRFTRNYS